MMNLNMVYLLQELFTQIKFLKNYGSETGDILILTKPIGLGIINTAIKAKIASKEAYEKSSKSNGIFK